jgi:hypothetical protein
LKEINHIHYEHEVVKHAEEDVFRHTKAGEFIEAYELVLLIDRFIRLHGGFHSEFYILTGLNLAKYLVGVGTNRCRDQKLYGSMFGLSLEILQDSLRGLDRIDMELYELQQLLADLISVLSEQKKYIDLEVSSGSIPCLLAYTYHLSSAFSKFFGTPEKSATTSLPPLLSSTLVVPSFRYLPA